MSLIRWEPFNEFDKFFSDDFFNKALSTGMRTMGFDLAVDVYEDKGGNVVAEMNLPGINPDDVEIEVENNHLIIAGKREAKKEEDGEGYYSREIKRGSFSRSIRLPSAVKADNVKAEYKDGVLKVVLPKQEKENEKRKIQIERK